MGWFSFFCRIERKTNVAVTIEILRDFIRDQPELNTLIGEKETEDTGLTTAIEDAIDDWNNTPPFTTVTVDNFPYKSLLKIGATVFVLKSAGIMMSRNHLTYNDGGISIEKDEKTQLYQSWLDRFEPEWERKKAGFKLAKNLENCWGGI